MTHKPRPWGSFLCVLSDYDLTPFWFYSIILFIREGDPSADALHSLLIGTSANFPLFDWTRAWLFLRAGIMR